MSTTAVKSHFVGIGYSVAFVAVSLSGLLSTLSADRALVPGSVMPWLVLFITGYALLGTLGLYLVERRGTRAQLYAVLAVLAAVGSASTLLSHGYAAMMLLALVSASVFYLPPRASVGMSVALSLVALFAFSARSSVWFALAQAEIAFGSGIAFVFVFSRIALREQRARTEIERLAADLGTANGQLAAQADEAKGLATLAERNRIAREIHDGLGHYLTVVHVQLEAAKTLLTSEPERARAALGKAQQLTHEVLNEVRRSVSLLRGEAALRPGLVEALGLLAAECSQAGMATQVRVEGKPRHIAEPVELTLYRTAQEGLTNAQRHACASHVDIALVFGETGNLCLRVQDDGVGGEPVRSGFGLRGLRERAELVGGQVSIRSRPQQGFCLELQVPG
jgi:signal transduction histidine kinase